MTDRTVDVRYLQHSAGEYITNVYDALVELITNSDDAYSRKKGGGAGGEIIIEHHGVYGRTAKTTPARIVVRDTATGMTDHRMRRIAVFGRKTSGSADRGFFGSGLKNCQNIADILVESIVDDVYYHGKMSFASEKNIEVSDRPQKPSAGLRKALGIPKGLNGTVITLILKGTVKLPRLSTMKRELPYLYGLRQICSQTSQRKVFLTNGKTGARYAIKYHRPLGELVYEEIFKIQGHECRFKLFKSEEKLEETPDSTTGRSGVLIYSGNVCHELTHFDVHNRTNPFAVHYFGELRCDRVVEILREFDENNPTEDNPVLIVKPTREGLNRNHPFAAALLKKPTKILKEFLEADEKERNAQKDSIVSSKTRVLFTKIARCMGELFEEEDEEDDNLYPMGKKGEDVIQSKGILVVPEQVKVALGFERVITVYALKNSVKQTDKLVVTADSSQMTIKSISKLKTHPKHDDRFISHFTVVPEVLEDSWIDIKIGNLSAAALVEAVKEHKRNFTKKLEFTTKTEFVEGEHELRVYAHRDIMRGNEKLPFKVTKRGGGIVMLGNVKSRNLTIRPGTNYATGVVRIRCEKIGSEVDFEAKLGTYKAKTTLKVVNPKIIKKTPFSIEFDSQEAFRFRWQDEHTLLISAMHPAMRPLLGRAPKYSGQDTPVAQRALIDTAIDAMATRFLQQKAAKGSLRLAGKTEENIIENINAEREREILRVSKKLFKTLK
jgi:hypothetical protein